MTQSPEPVDTFSLLRARTDDPPNIKMLRFVVIGMGLVLVVGVFAVLGRISFLLMRPSPDTAPPAPAPLAQGTGREIAATLALPDGAKVLGHAIAGNRLSVHYATAAGEEAIAVLDLDTGRVVARIALRAPAR